VPQTDIFVNNGNLQDRPAPRGPVFLLKVPVTENWPGRTGWSVDVSAKTMPPTYPPERPGTIRNIEYNNRFAPSSP